MNSQKLLSVWEANWNRTPCEQAVALVAGMQSLSYDSAANLLIGQRDRLLFDIQTQLFGTQLALITNCPAWPGGVRAGSDYVGSATGLATR